MSDARKPVISTVVYPDLYQYPDSGKTGASHFLGRDANGMPQVVQLRNREENNLRYWEGE